VVVATVLWRFGEGGGVDEEEESEGELYALNLEVKG